MAARASSYYDLPFDELYDAERLVIVLTSGVREVTSTPENPDELAYFEGRLVAFCPTDTLADELLEIRVPVQVSTYSAWSGNLPSFDRTPSPDLGSVAVRIGLFDEGAYCCRVAILDQGESLTSMLLLSLLSAALAGEPEVKVSLSGRSDQSFSKGLVSRYAWEECGVEAEDFGEALDAGEQEPPLAQFTTVAFDVQVDAKAIAKKMRP